MNGGRAWASRSATAAWAVVAVVSATLAFVYLTRQSYMPYHAAAVGLRWEELSPEVQTLYLALMRVAGGGWGGHALFVLGCLVLGQRAGAARILLLPTTLMVHGSTLWATSIVTLYTPAVAPWYGELAVLAIGLVAAVLDWVPRQAVAGLSAVLVVYAASPAQAQAASAPLEPLSESPAVVNYAARPSSASRISSNFQTLHRPAGVDPLDRALRDAHSTAESWHYSWLGIFGAGLATRIALGLALDGGIPLVRGGCSCACGLTACDRRRGK